MPDGWAAPRIGAEHRGLARVFRSRVKALDQQTEDALAAIIAPLRDRLSRHPKLRAEQVAAAVRAYGLTVPVELRIGQVTVERNRERFSIRETRLIASWQRQTAWQGDDTDEPGIAIARFALKLHTGRLIVTWEPVSIVSLHSLARRIERGADPSHGAIYADLATLADPDPEARRVAAGDGFWVGAVGPMHGQGQTFEVFNVRTWHE
jgi:hypothetical protein